MFLLAKCQACISTYILSIVCLHLLYCCNLAFLPVMPLSLELMMPRRADDSVSCWQPWRKKEVPKCDKRKKTCFSFSLRPKSWIKKMIFTLFGFGSLENRLYCLLLDCICDANQNPTPTCIFFICGIPDHKSRIQLRISQKHTKSFNLFWHTDGAYL